MKKHKRLTQLLSLAILITLFLIMDTTKKPSIAYAQADVPSFDVRVTTMSKYMEILDNVDAKAYITANYYYSPDDDMTQAQFEEIREFTKKLIEGTNSEYDKVRIIHDWIANNVYYNMDSYIDNINGESGLMAYDVFTKRIAMCGGYTELTHAMLTSVDIPVINVYGYADGLSGWESHAWNMAYVDGRWISIDTTFDSNNIYQYETKTPAKSSSTYFDMSPEKFSQNHYIIDIDQGFIIDKIAYKLSYDLSYFSAYYPYTEELKFLDSIAGLPVISIGALEDEFDEPLDGGAVFLCEGFNIKKMIFPSTFEYINLNMSVQDAPEYIEFLGNNPPENLQYVWDAPYVVIPDGSFATYANQIIEEGYTDINNKLIEKSESNQLMLQEYGNTYFRIKKLSGYQYSIDGKSYQSSNMFKNLKKNTIYTVYAKKENTVLKRTFITADEDDLDESDIYTPEIKLGKTSFTLEKGKTAKINATAINSKEEMEFESSDVSIATVSKKGVITAKKKGTCTIKVSLKGTKSKTIKVTVKDTKPSIEVKDTLPAFTLLSSDNKLDLNSLFTFNNCTAVTFASSNKNIATISKKGIITIHKMGSVTITMKSNGIVKKLKITVEAGTGMWKGQKFVYFKLSK